MYFDVVAIKPKKLSDAIYAIKMLAHGRVVNPPHITVRGPFATPTSEEQLRHLDRKIIGNQIIFNNFSTFTSPTQYTVFLNFTAGNLATIWKKDSYPVELYGITPHLTIYDSKPSEFSSQLLILVSQYNDLGLSLVADRLEVFSSSFGYESEKLRIASLILDAEFYTLEEANQQLSQISSLERLSKIRHYLDVIRSMTQETQPHMAIKKEVNVPL